MKKPITDARRNKIGYIDQMINGKAIIYDKMGRKIGEIRPHGTRMLDAYNTRGQKIATYDSTTDTTKVGFKKIGKGNLLVGMFFEG